MTGFAAPQRSALGRSADHGLHHLPLAARQSPVASSNIDSDQLLSRQAFDIGDTRADDKVMSATTDKDYIDAKLEGTSAHLLGEVRLANAEFAGDLKEYQAQSIARMDMLDQTLKSGMQSAREELNTKLAQIEANAYRIQSEIIKWVVGAVIGGVALTISATSFLLSSAGLKSSSPPAAPIVVYSQPAPPAQAAPPAPANRP